MMAHLFVMKHVYNKFLYEMDRRRELLWLHWPLFRLRLSSLEYLEYI
jgi:hypothetical protein